MNKEIVEAARAVAKIRADQVVPDIPAIKNQFSVFVDAVHALVDLIEIEVRRLPVESIKAAADDLCLVLGATLAPTCNNVFAQNDGQKQAIIDAQAILSLAAGLSVESVKRRAAPFKIGFLKDGEGVEADDEPIKNAKTFSGPS